jgi:hypothetical protein
MVSSQWRRSGLGEIEALDYAALAVPLSFYPLKKQKKLFHGVRMVEIGVLKGLRKNGEKLQSSNTNNR